MNMGQTLRPRRMPPGLLVACFTPVAVAVAVIASASPSATESAGRRVLPNDNQHPAGAFEAGALTLMLRAASGSWQPEGPDGPSLSIDAFGEGSAALTVPGPLIRVQEGTPIVASVRNDLDAMLSMHGLCTHDGTPCSSLDIPPGETRTLTFASGAAGTYHYWASSFGAPIPFRELGGAFIVDPRGGAAQPDRVMVMTEWSSLHPDQIRQVITADVPDRVFASLHPGVGFMINGLSWPATERLTYQLHETVRWRVINLTSQAHPMHLHGFYFEVDSLGDGLRDQPIPGADHQSVVTQLLPPGGTMTMTWTPQREGNWLFHCHIMQHVSPQRRLSPVSDPHGHGHASHDTSGGMAGMIMGITVRGRDSVPSPDDAIDPGTVRRLRLVMAKGTAGPEPSFGFLLSGDGSRSTPDRVSTPGPALVLRRNEPVEITVVNHLGESTAVHWHGMELESIYDGVHGWSGIDRRVAPMIEPEASFVVRFTPPRTGTFIYHTHLHDQRQLPFGLYGPLIVVEPEETFDPETDHVIMVGRSGLDPAAPDVLVSQTPVVLNGVAAPEFVWKAGSRHRVRLINITPGDIFSVSLQTSQGPAQWTPITKDGAPVPASARHAVPARQTIAVGETYDFEVDVEPGRRKLWIEVRSTGGKWEAQGMVIVR
jgi:FtsP/CotA-like multicopper oxidase with cupredoxin domain